MTDRFRTTRRMEFRDTDAAGIIHFSRFFTLMEEVEHEFLRALGTSVVAEYPELGTVSWPRVAAKCDFAGSLRFEDIVEIALAVRRVGNSSVTYEFAFTHSGREIARGEMTCVCCRIEHGKPPESISIPQPLFDQLDRYLIETEFDG